MKKNIEGYINNANYVIKVIEANGKIADVERVLKTTDFNFLRQEMFEKCNISENSFIISSDTPRNNHEINILEQVLSLNDKIVYISDDISYLSLLKYKYREQIFEYKVLPYQIAFLSDIHIYFYDQEFLTFLNKNGRCFNFVHPDDYPFYNPKIADDVGWNREKQAYVLGGNVYFRSMDDVIYALYKNIITREEIDRIYSKFGLERFLVFLELSTDNKNLLYYQRELNFKYSDYDKLILGKNNTNAVKADSAFFNILE